jgi:Zn finger protein HypA/HybF involved in hydrogenase expression
MPTPITKIEIKCRNCGTLFKSGFLMTNSVESLKAINMSGNLEQCPKCGSPTPCNKEDMIVDGVPYAQL